MAITRECVTEWRGSRSARRWAKPGGTRGESRALSPTKGRRSARSSEARTVARPIGRRGRGDRLVPPCHSSPATRRPWTWLSIPNRGGRYSAIVRLAMAPFVVRRDPSGQLLLAWENLGFSDYTCSRERSRRCGARGPTTTPPSRAAWRRPRIGGSNGLPSSPPSLDHVTTACGGDGSGCSRTLAPAADLALGATAGRIASLGVVKRHLAAHF